jgi:regulatory protein
MTEDQRVLAEVREEQGSVFLALDSGEVFELAPGSVPGQLPAVGESISSPLLAEIRFAAERKQVARRVFAMLDHRLYPVARLRAKLAEHGFGESAVDAVLQQMADQGLFSDRQYAEAYCRDCLATKAVGRLYLEKKLREKRVEPAVAARVAAEALDSATEKELALQAARVKWGRERGSDRRKSEAKVMRYLMGRGFPAQVASQAVRQAAPRTSEETE